MGRQKQDLIRPIKWKLSKYSQRQFNALALPSPLNARQVWKQVVKDTQVWVIKLPASLHNSLQFIGGSSSVKNLEKWQRINPLKSNLKFKKTYHFSFFFLIDLTRALTPYSANQRMPQWIKTITYRVEGWKRFPRHRRSFDTRPCTALL